MAKRRAAKELRKADEWANAYFRTRTISFVCGMLVCLKSIGRCCPKTYVIVHVRAFSFGNLHVCAEHMFMAVLKFLSAYHTRRSAHYTHMFKCHSVTSASLSVCLFILMDSPCPPVLYF